MKSKHIFQQPSKNYSELEHHYLAIVYGHNKNCLYLLGRLCTFYGNQKPIVSILNKPKTITSLRNECLISVYKAMNLR